MSSLELAHVLREEADPAFVLTDNKSVTRFVPPLLNACEYLLQVNFELAHIADSINKAVPLLSGPKLKVTGRSDPRSGETDKPSQKRCQCLPWM